MKDKNINKIVFIELDGASWNVMNPLLEKGKLPNIHKLMQRGIFSGLATEAPYISPKIWTSIFTGKKQEKHGISFFGATSNMVNCKRIWDIFNEGGLKIGILGSLVTWPPRAVNGFVIPSICAIGPETYPDDYVFFQELALNERRKSKRMGNKKHMLNDLVTYTRKLRNNGVNLNSILYALRHLIIGKIKRTDQKDKYWRKATIYLKFSSQIFSYLYNKFKPDFTSFHIHLCDSLAHRYWMFYEPDLFPDVSPSDIKKYKNVLPDSYIEADRAIGQVLSVTGKDTTIIVVSDHGSKAMTDKKDTYDIKIDKFLDILEINQKVVVARFGPGVYLHFQERELLQRTEKNIKKISLKENGDKLFFVKMHNDILVVTKATWKVDAGNIREDSVIDFGDLGLYKIGDIFSKQKMKISGVHDKEGIFIAAGPDIREGSKPDNPTIYDLTPTMLALKGYPVAKDMDGRVLVEIIKDDFLKKHPLNYIESYEDSSVKESEAEDLDYDKIKVRLEGLGYL